MMERALKERIIGAVVLVIFVVLVVPIFLDGEKGEIKSERLLLPGQEDQDTKTVVLDRGRSEPIPVANQAAQETTTKPLELPKPEAERPMPVVDEATEQQAARVEKKPPPVPQEEATAPATSTTGMWAVQLGSFSNKENAEKLAADLRKQGYAAFLSQLQTNSGQLHRVRIGPQKDRESAEAMAARLLKVNHKGQVVPHP